MFWFYSANEERERKVKPPPWKKMMTRREVVSMSVSVSMSVGTKRRNQRLSCRRKTCGLFSCVWVCATKLNKGWTFFFFFGG